jgi:hypothetical protein|tara:strand:+ start:388 stop:1551 length:1164 start_codon:yes stop_codon:yes gene_type:complete
MSYTIKKTGSVGDSIIASNVPFIDRLTIKAGTVLLEDLRDYALQEKLHGLTESSDYGEGRQWMTGDYQDVLRKYTSGTSTLGNTIMSKIQSEQADGRTYTKPLISGVLGAGQQYYLPLGMLAASGSQALQLELFLADAHQVITRNTGVTDNISYEISDIKLHLQVVELPERALGAFNSAIMSGGTVRVPFSTTRVFQQHVPANQTHIDFSVVESSKQVEKIQVAMRPQSKTSSYTTVNVLESPEDAYDLRGGENSGGTVVEKFQFRIGNNMFPPRAIEVTAGKGTAPVILAGLASTDCLNKSMRLTSIDIDGNPVFENRGFFIQQGFKSSNDPIENGISTAVGQGPIELKLDFSAQNTALSMFAFVTSRHHLNITATGSVSMTDGTD